METGYPFHIQEQPLPSVQDINIEPIVNIIFIVSY